MTTTPLDYEHPILRNAALGDLRSALSDLHTLRDDSIVPARSLALDGSASRALATVPYPTLDDDGVGFGRFVAGIGPAAHEHLADRTRIPLAYWRRMAAEAPGLLAENANHWLALDDRLVMVRALRRPSEAGGYLRAVLSNRYAVIDSLDVMMAALDGVRSTGLDPGGLLVDGDLSERNFRLRVTAPQIGMEVPELLSRYRDPATGRDDDRGLVWAGLAIGNSEVGGGAFTVTPRIVVRVCSNGMTRPFDALRSVHVGGRMEEGPVVWSADTQRIALDLVSAKTRDAVAAFLSPGYLASVVAEWSEAAGVRLTSPADTLASVSKALSYTDAQQDAIMAAFVSGGDVSAFGVAQAVTFVAGQLLDPDLSASMEDSAHEAMRLAAAHAR
jgi:hypothetical protein